MTAFLTASTQMEANALIVAIDAEMQGLTLRLWSQTASWVDVSENEADPWVDDCSMGNAGIAFEMKGSLRDAGQF